MYIYTYIYICSFCLHSFHHMQHVQHVQRARLFAFSTVRSETNSARLEGTSVSWLAQTSKHDWKDCCFWMKQTWIQNKKKQTNKKDNEYHINESNINRDLNHRFLCTRCGWLYPMIPMMSMSNTVLPESRLDLEEIQWDTCSAQR